MTTIIETERLSLRLWEPTDAPALFALTNNPLTMEKIGPYWDMKRVHTYINEMNEIFEKYGTTYFAVDEKKSGKFIGFIGIKPTPWKAPFTPAFDIGWRLLPDCWGQGYATEGAKASLAYAFKHCDLEKIVSYTTPQNSRSERVMQKIGMTRDIQGNFIHPKSNTLHLLYSIEKNKKQ